MTDGGAQGAGFCLPAEFFDDFVTGKENLAKNQSAESGADLIFPTEFPYELETPADENFGKRWGMSTSPQSTLACGGIWSAGGSSSNGSSPNGVYSPPTTPVGDAVTDLIHRAVGQVAKLKLDVADHRTQNLVVAPRNFNQFHTTPKNSNQTAFHNIHLQQQQKQGSCRVWYGEPQMHQIKSTEMSMEALIGQQSWSNRGNPTRFPPSGVSDVPLGAFLGGAQTKRGRTGTGVFLPRRYDGSSFSLDPRRKTGSPCFPGGNYDNKNGFAQSRPQFHPKPINQGFILDYDLLIARRNAVLLQHRRRVFLEQQSSSPMSFGMHLPQEWSY